MAQQKTEPSELDYQPTLHGYRPVMLTIGVVFAVISIVSVILWLPMRQQQASPKPETRYDILQLPPGDKIRQQQMGKLHGYEWLDREQRIARIPVDQAMALLIEHGSEPFFPQEEQQSENIKEHGNLHRE